MLTGAAARRAAQVASFLATLSIFGAAGALADQGWPFGPQPALRPIAWRTTAAPGGRGGAENEAIMQTADIDRSDPGFVGMMVRCRDKTLETILVVVDPLPPRTTAQVTLTGDGKTIAVAATPILTGAGLKVPVDLLGQLNGGWAGEPMLDVTMMTPDAIHGAVSLNGLRAPLLQLNRDCGMDAPDK